MFLHRRRHTHVGVLATLMLAIMGLAPAAHAAPPPASPYGAGLCISETPCDHHGSSAEGSWAGSWRPTGDLDWGYCIDPGQPDPNPAVPYKRDGTSSSAEQAYLLFVHGATSNNSLAAAVNFALGTPPPNRDDPNPTLTAQLREEASRLAGPYRTAVTISRAALIGDVGQVQVRVLSAAGNPLSGASVHLSATNAQVAPTVTTNAAGLATVAFTPRAAGTVRITAQGMSLPATTSPVFSAPGGYQRLVTKGAATTATRATDAYVARLPMTSLRITKSAPDPSGVVGAYFVVTRGGADGQVVAEHTMTAADKGTVTFPATGEHFDPTETYTVREVSTPPGFAAVDVVQEARLMNDGRFAVEFRNAAIPARITLVKTDRASGKPLAGAVYEVRSGNGTQVATFPATNTAGRANLELPPGTYKVHEITAPRGYRLSTEPLPLKVEYGDTALTVTAADMANSVTLVKTDRTSGKPLAGAVYDLTDCRATKIATFPATDTSGRATIHGVPAGTWCAVEKVAPVGYTLDAAPVRVALGTAGGDITVVATDTAMPTEVLSSKLAHTGGNSQELAQTGGSSNPLYAGGFAIGLLVLGMSLLAGARSVGRR